MKTFDIDFVKLELTNKKEFICQCGNQRSISIKKENYMRKLFIWINHIFKNHNTFNMPVFMSNKGNGWCCPYCNWKHWDIASCEMNEK